MAQSYNTSLQNIADCYLRLLKAKVTQTTAKKYLEESPFYPSLLSLSDTFTRNNIENKAFEIPKEHFDKLQTPFVAFVNMPGVGKDFVLVTNKNKGKVDFIYKNKKIQTVSNEIFLQRYRNIVWLAEPDDKSGESDYDKKLETEKKMKMQKMLWYFTIVLFVIIAAAINLDLSNLFSFGSIALLKIVGTATCVALLLYEIDKSNPFLKNLCSTGSHANCDAVLSSKASKFMGLSWAEIGFYYFASTSLFLMLPTVTFLNKVALLAIANGIASTYILFSIYYQWRIIKQWCPLCLSVQIILVCELVWSIINYWSSLRLYSPRPDYSNLSINFMAGILCILFPVILWIGLKPLLKNSKNVKLYSSAYKRLQYNPEIFDSILRQQPKAPEGWQHLGVSLGNANASNIIIKVCNPYCGPCAKMHPLLEEIIKNNSNVQVKIIFTTRQDDDERKVIVTKHLLAIAQDAGRKKIQQALDDWYLPEKKDYVSFAAKYPTDGNLNQQNIELAAMSNWCIEAEITHTPTLFVNGYRLAENYNVEDLKNIL